MDSKVDAPSAWTMQQISLGNLGVIEDICSHGWKRKRGRIPDLVAISLIEFSDYDPTIGRLGIKIAVRIEGRHANITGHFRTAVIAYPERRETRPGLGKHVKARLPASDDRICPSGHG